MHAVQSYQEFSGHQYVDALLHCSGKKVCTNLADTMNTSHDSIYRNFENPIQQTDTTIDVLKNLAMNNLNNDNIYLIFDDTQITKWHAKKIEGLEVNFDGSIGVPAPGITVVTSLLTDTIIDIPIDAKPFFSKELVQAHYKTKSEIAIDITCDVVKSFNIKRILGDAHYATKQNLGFLHSRQLPYLMKIPRNRVVTIDGIHGQLQRIFRLKKNSHMQSIKGTFHGIDCYFYVIKIKDGTIIYLISNDQIDLKKVLELYRIRWHIELFHRTAKQYLGMKDCQMIAIEKQRLHVLFVMHAYAVASIRKVLMHVSCVENVIKYYRNLKTNVCNYSTGAVGANLC